MLFYLCWLFLNLIQSAVTGLFDDESYYWVYSRFLDWGYFDHPPMIALLIKGGYAILPNELGVRLFIAILSTATLWLVQKLLKAQDDILFYTIAISIAVFQLGGFIAVPDVPLLFFTAVFFHAYKKFLSKGSLRNGVLLGISAACLMYSKYNGALVLLLTFLSNPKLLFRSQVYIAAIVAFVLFLPHIYWQYSHGFPSIQYHLKERVDSSYNFSFTLEYMFQQLLVVGPVSSIVLIWACLRRRPSDELERALKFTTVGIYAVFLLYTFRGPVEANWTFPSFIGLIVLSHQYLVDRSHLRKLVNILALITLCIVFAGRLYLAGIFPRIELKEDEFLSNREWTSEVNTNSKGLPVFFVDSYQRASKYWSTAAVQLIH
jgi:4-amino-4-deoxy-L-arabinose transferase-like glycosyltransferase